MCYRGGAMTTDELVAWEARRQSRCDGVQKVLRVLGDAHAEHGVADVFMKIRDAIDFQCKCGARMAISGRSVEAARAHMVEKDPFDAWA